MPKATLLYPSLYQLNTRCLLRDLGDGAKLEDIPEKLLKSIGERGFDWVWPLGIWQTGEAARAISREQPEWRREYEQTLPDLTDKDITGSPFAIKAYAAHRTFGGKSGLSKFRKRLEKRGLKLLLDFVPNHTAPDHDWVTEHPEFYIQGSGEDLTREPHNYARVGRRIFAHGRDPYFPGWPDTLQLNYRHPGLRAAMIEQLLTIAEQCDGIRCDMAMLLLPEVIQRTWGDRSLPADRKKPVDGSFWIEAIAAVRAQFPDFQWMAEAYWDLEWELQQQGFDYTYDKRLYDRLREGHAAGVRGHLCADGNFMRKSVRFLENHDEPRAAAVFPNPQHRAAAAVAFLVPGLRFFHEGQLEGRRVRISMHLGRRPDEPADPELQAFYERLLEVLRRSEVRSGEWRMCATRAAYEGSTSHEQMLIFLWELDKKRLLVAVNYSAGPASGFVELPVTAWEGKTVRLTDLLGEAVYDREDLPRNTLYVDLPPWGCQAFAAEVL